VAYALANRAAGTFTGLFTSLQQYWPLQEGSGQARRDHTTGQKDCTDVNTVPKVTGKVDKLAADFTTANNEYLYNTLAGDWQDNSASVIAWVNLKTNTTDYIIASRTDEAGNDRSWKLYYSQADNRFAFAISNNGTAYQVTRLASTFGAPSTSTWYFVWAFHDAANDEVGISVNDGTADKTAHTSGFWDSAAPFNIGARGGSGGAAAGYMNGLIEQVGLWNKKLSAAEVTLLYGSGSGLIVF